MGLVLEIGGMTLEEMQSRMSSAELTLWMARNRLENEDTEKRTREADAKRGAEQRAREQLRR